MHGSMGVAAICVGAALWLGGGTLLRTRLARPASVALLAIAGGLVGAGALLVQTRASTLEWAFTLVILGIAGPVESRVIFGPFGRMRGAASGTVGRD